MRRGTTIALVVLLACAPCRAADDAGTHSPFSFGVGARDLALGGAGIATSDWATAPFWNASRLAHAERFAVSAFHSRLYDSDVGYQYFGIAAPTLDFGTFGLGIARMGVGGIDGRDAHNLPTGTFRDDRLGLYLAYGRVIWDYDFGLTMSLEHHSIDDYSTTSSPGLSFSVGRTLKPKLGWLREATLSMTGNNLVQPGLSLSTERVEYPYIFDGGVSMLLAPCNETGGCATFSARIEKPDAGAASLSAGLEIALLDLVQVRGGYRDHHPSAGAGLTYRSTRFDYALVGRDLGSIHMFTISTFFGAPVSERRARRAQKREAQFVAAMADQVESRNRQLIADLVAQGEQYMQDDDFVTASQRFDRALFLAGDTNADTLRIRQLLDQAQQKQRDREQQTHLARLMDSTAARFADGDYISARYLANLVLAETPGSVEARVWQRRADSALAELASADEMLKSRLAEVDSLLSYGKTDEALAIAKSAAEFAPNDDRVQSALRRARFEALRTEATHAYESGLLQSARRVLDSALTLFPGHQWCISFRARIGAELAPAPEPLSRAAKAVTKESLSGELLKQVEENYQEGQNSFSAGKLTEAIAHWETVDRIAPGYQSVRAYLVKAYRLAGVELYGQNRLPDAVAMWKKAAALEPGNSEIRSYIERTETEIIHLKELSYDER